MRIRFEIEVTKTDGPRQDVDEVVNILTENIESIGDFYVQDGEHDNESQYTVGEVKHLETIK